MTIHFLLLPMLLLSALTMANVTVNDPDEHKRQLETLRQEITEIKTRLQQTQGKRDRERELLQQTEVKINTLLLQLKNHQSRQRQLKQQLDLLYSQQTSLQSDIQQNRQTLASMTQASYMMGKDNVLKVLLNQEDPELASRILEYYQYLSRYRLQKIDKLRNSISDLSSVEDDISETAGENRKILEQNKTAQHELQQQNRQRAELIAHLNLQIKDGKSHFQKLKADEKRLLKLLDELTTLSRSELGLLDKGSFADMKGKLRLPVDAPIKATYGTAKGQGDLRWNGILLKVNEGQKIAAVYRGQVIFADFFRGFGLLLILDHGDGYMSLYSHTQSILKQIGDWVDTGEIIATSGSTGGLSQPGLYFEIRVHGKPSDPLLWCRR